MTKTLPSIAVAAFLCGCVATGPQTADILGDEDAQVVVRDATLNYGVVSMDSGLAAQATSLKRASERRSFIRNSGAPGIALGVGDQVQVNIVSTNDMGFLDITNSSLSPFSTTSLPPQQIAPDGMISVPPIGRIRAAGNSVQAFERILTRRLGEEMIEPTAIVQLIDRQSAQVTLVGSIGAPGTYSINQNNRFLVDVIALAGGTGPESENVQVVMTRGRHTGTAQLNDIYENPDFNVALHAGDIIRFEQFRGQFTVLGAGGVNANLNFADRETNLVEALGLSGGILTNRADPSGVFIYRTVSRDAAARLGIDTTEIFTESVPIIYHFDLLQPEALFIAQEFEIADGDILYVSTSVIAEINAALAAFGSFVPSPREVVTTAVATN